MKKFFFLFLLSANIHAATLSENLFLNSKSGFDVSDEQISSLENSVGEIVDLNSNIVERSFINKSARAESKWKASGYVTSIGVTSTGKLGILGFKGSAMAEIYWRKKAVNRIFANDLTTSEQTDAELSDLSESGINDSLEHLMAIVIGSKKVESPENVRSSLKQKLTEFAEMVKYTHTDQSKPWYLAGIRLDLAVSGSGNLTPVYTVGAALNLRVVWVPVKAKNRSLLASQTGSNSLSKMTEDLTLILAEIPDNQALEAKGLALSTIRFGLGVTAAGKVFFGKGDGSLVLSVLMNKNPNFGTTQKINQFHSVEMKNQALPIENNSEIENMDWRLFKKGLEKSLKLSRSFIGKNVDPEKEQNKKWEVNTIKTSYSMNLTKGVGLVTIGEVAQLQMTYKK